MEIIFLGTGETHGMPLGLCECKFCKDKNVMPRFRPSLILKENETNILFDISPDIRTQIIENNITKIDYVFITHAHFDHFGGLIDYNLFPNSKRGKIYVSKDVYNYTKKLYPWINVELEIFDDFKEYKFGHIKIIPFPVNHDNKFYTNGFLICYKDTKTVYAPDFYDIPINSIDLIKNSDIVIIDGQYPFGKYLPDPLHIDTANLMKIIKSAKFKKVYLIGISEHYLKMNELSIQNRLPNNFKIPHDKQKINLT